MSEPEGHFVTCPCRTCGGGIEFDAGLLAPENCKVPCPHCGVETQLFLPAQPSAQSQRVKAPLTPKQLAFLTYMGFPEADKLTKQEAGALIDSDGFSPLPQSMAGWERQERRKRAWQTDRLVLYPALYAEELDWHLTETLPGSLHRHVRGLFVGSSQRLTKAKIRQVIQALTSENPTWWHQSGYEAVFVERLRQMYAACCDGTR